MKFNEVQKYVTNIRYIFSLEPLIVSETVFQQQTPEMQKIILEAGQEATEHSFAYLENTENQIREELQAKGMVFTDPADNEQEWISKVTKSVWPKFYSSIGSGGRHLLPSAVSLRTQRATFTALGSSLH